MHLFFMAPKHFPLLLHAIVTLKVWGGSFKSAVVIDFNWEELGCADHFWNSWLKGSLAAG